MSRSRSLLATAAGVSTFLVVALAVTAVLEDRIWPSAFVGLPVGVVAGGLALWVVYVRDETSAGRALGGFGVAFLPSFVVLAAVGIRLSLALPVAFALAVLAGVAYALKK